MESNFCFEIKLNSENKFMCSSNDNPQLAKLIGKKIRIKNVDIQVFSKDDEGDEGDNIIKTCSDSNVILSGKSNVKTILNSKQCVNSQVFILKESKISIEKNDDNQNEFKISVKYQIENDNNIPNLKSEKIRKEDDYLIYDDEDEEEEDEDFEEEELLESDEESEHDQLDNIKEQKENSVDLPEEEYEDLLNEANDLNEDICLYDSDDQISQLYYDQNNDLKIFTNSNNNIEKKNVSTGKKYLLRKRRASNNL